MTKQEYLNTAKTGDIVLYSNLINPLALAIQMFSGKGSHAGTVIYCWGKPFLAESNGKGVHISPLEKRLKGNYCIRRSIVPVDEKSYSVRALSVMGANYDFSSLLFRQPLFIASGGKWFIQNPKYYDRSFYCSEFCAYAHQLENWHLFTPNDLYETHYFGTIKEWN